MKQEIISNIHKLLAASIRIPHSYHRRSRGFMSEMKFKQKCKEDNIKYLDGGWILFRGGILNENKETVYVTTSFDDPEDYTGFYMQLKNCPLIKEMFFFKILPYSEWYPVEIKNGKELTIILRPRFEIYVFSGSGFRKSDQKHFLNYFPKIKKELFYRTDTKDVSYLDYLNEFSEEELTELYAGRFVVDYMMKGRDMSYGMDFDGVIIEDEGYFAAETKEKDPGPSNRNNVPQSEWFFGWDTLRMLWYMYLMQTTGIKCYSIILEIDNQKDRNPVAWKRCELLKLCESINYSSAISGGVGMGPSKGSTTIAPYSVFEEF